MSISALTDAYFLRRTSWLLFSFFSTPQLDHSMQKISIQKKHNIETKVGQRNNELQEPRKKNLFLYCKRSSKAHWERSECSILNV